MTRNLMKARKHLVALISKRIRALIVTNSMAPFLRAVCLIKSKLSLPQRKKKKNIIPPFNPSGVTQSYF